MIPQRGALASASTYLLRKSSTLIGGQAPLRVSLTLNTIRLVNSYLLLMELRYSWAAIAARQALGSNKSSPAL